MLTKYTVAVFTALSLCSWAKKFPFNPEEKDPNYWNQMAKKTLEEALINEPIKKRAKNVILMIGDGYSMTTITASRILKGQKQGKSGEESILNFEKFPNIGLSKITDSVKCVTHDVGCSLVSLYKTYAVDHQISDSAGCGTALLNGVKSTYATIGVSGLVKRGDCPASLKHRGQSILGHAQDDGKATGIVSTARVTHATPATAYAASSDRRWESDKDMPSSVKKQGCEDIGAQVMRKVGKSLKVLMGGGRRELTPNNRPDEENAKEMGRRLDGRNIINEWVQYRKSKGDKTSYVWNSDQLKKVKNDLPDSLIGLFEAAHMKYTLDNTAGDDPTLADMAETAINVLKKNDAGYVLLIEAARIDTAHHDNYATLALHEALEFDKAIERVVSVTSDDDTLIIVTADHAHALLMHSYATRGNYILGLTDYTDDDQPGGPNGNSDIDGKPYTTLLYGNGPGYTAPREDISRNKTDAPYFKIQAGIPNQWVSHDGTDVPIYARGPMSHLVHTTHEQNYVFHVMKYAACLGEHKGAPHCTGNVPTCRGCGLLARTSLTVLAAFVLAFFFFRQ